MHPGLIQAINRRFGVDYMANVGGAIHGHPDGTRAGVLAMLQAIDGTCGPEYARAIEKWGIVV
jgi:ribulose 1,5-bisphosphate carboxylase large subunit-like protein